jgi:hypothetical protein
MVVKHVTEGQYVVLTRKANVEGPDGLALSTLASPHKEAELGGLIFAHGHPGDVREVGALSHERSRRQTIRARLVHSTR